ncbi:MAG: hypothetical protein KBD78_03545 [Oligoflexales bacterium]|nr:hypothetical protein [Oligoflexales bacterium]
MKTHFSKIILLTLSLFIFACGKDDKSNNQDGQKDDQGTKLVEDEPERKWVRPPKYPLVGKWVWSDDRAYSVGGGPHVVYYYDVREDFSATYIKPQILTFLFYFFSLTRVANFF